MGLENFFFKGDECDELKNQYKDFIRLSKLDYRNKFANYNVLTDRLDTFLFSIIGSKEEYFKLWEFIKDINLISWSSSNRARFLVLTKAKFHEYASKNNCCSKNSM